MAIRFKFRSAVEFDSVQIEGNGIGIWALKERILQKKNLGKGPNLDLVITNAETGEEYLEDSFLPKNTSVIIKRVPARHAKSTVLVHDEFVEDANDQELLDKEDDSAQMALTSTMDDLYDMGDFGVDLYAVDESALTNVDGDEVNHASALKAGEKRPIQELYHKCQSNMDAATMRNTVKGHNFGKALPPPGYVCHRCSQPGHFIQHCPTNGDPAYDVKRGTRLRKELEGPGCMTGTTTQARSCIKEVDLVPSELRCPMCQEIFKEAVMIPCCQYSFCDACIKQALLEKDMCPQCCSEKTKTGNLLPNVALRQAIDRFLGSRREYKLHGEDVESAIKPTKVCLETTSELKDASHKVFHDQPELPVVDDSVCESAIGSRGKDVTDSGRVEEEEVAEASYAGKKKPKQHVRSTSVSESVVEPVVISKLKKSNRFCYICGSPEHLARHCAANEGDNANSYAPQRGVFHPVHPGAMLPYGQEMYWPSHPLMHVRPLPMAYGEGVYGSCSSMPYGVPALPLGPYGVPSFTAPIYSNPAVHGFLGSIAAPRVMVPKERPLSREEFMELQDREHKRRLMHGRQEREQSEQRAHSEGNDEESFSSASDRRFPSKRPPGDRPTGNNNYLTSSENKQKHVRRHTAESPDEDEFSDHIHESEDNSGYQESKDRRSHSQRRMQRDKSIHSRSKMAEKISSDREELQVAKGRSVREASKKGYSEKHEAIHEKHEYYGHVKHENTRISKVEVNVEGSHSSRNKSKRPMLEGARMVVPEDVEVKEMKKSLHHMYSKEDYDADEKHSEKRHHNHIKREMGDSISGEEGPKKKRKHKRHRSEESKEAAGARDAAIKEDSLRYKKTKLKHSSSKPSQDFEDVLQQEEDVEDGRWQMQDGLNDDDDAFVESLEPKRKHRHRRRRRRHHHHHHH